MKQETSLRLILRIMLPRNKFRVYRIENLYEVEMDYVFTQE